MLKAVIQKNRFMSTLYRMVLSSLILTFSSLSDAKPLPEIKVGILGFGTVNWEMSTIKTHELDISNGFRLAPVKLSSKNATAIALQSEAVDIIITDLFWVLKQQGKYLFHPTNKLTGGIYAQNASTAVTEIRKLGVAGGPNDKNLLIAKVYFENKGITLPKEIQYAAPPLLNALLIQSKFDGAINFWHYNARLEAAGFSNILSTETMLTQLGFKSDVPLLGWVFSSEYAKQHSQTLHAFLLASKAAKELMSTQHTEWDRLRPQLKVDNDAQFEALVRHYPNTLINASDKTIVASAQQIFDVLKQVDTQTIFRHDAIFDPSVFYLPELTDKLVKNHDSK